MGIILGPSSFLGDYVGKVSINEEILLRDAGKWGKRGGNIKYKRGTQLTTVERQVSLNFLLNIDCFRQSVAYWVPQI